MTEPSIIALLHGPDHPGIVAKVSSWIFERGGNILHADQHRDAEANIFFQRIEWIPASDHDHNQVIQDFSSFVSDQLEMNARVRSSSERARIALFVSRIPHCFHDILLRWKAGELKADFTGVISNHPDLEKPTEQYGLPFYHVPVSPETKAEAEKEQIRICQKHGVDLVVMARYMQILSPTLISGLGCPIINIHHSFLPAFAGGKPYRQAHQRGVKLIGATAHYATEDLDEGPIIHQDVSRVTHRHSVSDLTRKGRDLETMVFAQAIRWHLDDRVLVYNNKTVVFD